MLPQAYSLLGTKYNVIVLAGGNGSRMGNQSDYIPKALTQIGNNRAIDYIINKYRNVAHKFVVGTCRHADLLESYIKGKYSPLNIEFSREAYLRGSGISTMYALDHCDTDYGTIVLFCDLLVISNNDIKDDTVLVCGENTKGVTGTFRHTDKLGRGVLGNFTFSRTDVLKWVTYKSYADGVMTNTYSDITDDIAGPYNSKLPLSFSECKLVYEFGNENDVNKVRKAWDYSD